MERFVKMICKNCNGAYEANAIRCPFCGSENEAEAEKRKEQLLQHYDDEAKRIAAEVPKKAVKKGTKHTKNVCPCPIFQFINVYIIASALPAGEPTFAVFFPYLSINSL